MDRFFIPLLGFLALNSNAGQVDLVPKLPETVYIPANFDTNDFPVQIYVEGTLPNDCYRRSGKTRVERFENGRTLGIRIMDMVYFDKGATCTEQRVSYGKTIDLGLLPLPTDYDLEFVGPDQTRLYMEKAIHVEEAPAGEPRNKYHYAPVDPPPLTTVERVKGPDGRTRNELLLRGWFNKACQRIKGKPTLLWKPGNNVIEILPRMDEELLKSEDCEPVDRPFEEPFTIPDFYQGRYVIHIRSAGGGINLPVTLAPAGKE